MSGISATSPVLVMFDSSKGSLTNRADCAKEQLKNKLALHTKVTLPTAAVATAAVVKPNLLGKIATTVGKGLCKIIKTLTPNVASNKIAQKILANPTRLGAGGLIVAGGLWVLNALTKHIYKAGQIDQKYTDAAAIEKTTKNVVLDA